MRSTALSADNWVHLTELNRRSDEPMIIAPIIDKFLKATGPEPYPGCVDGIRKAFRVLYEQRYGIWIEDVDVPGIVQQETAASLKCDFKRSIQLDAES